MPTIPMFQSSSNVNIQSITAVFRYVITVFTCNPAAGQMLDADFTSAMSLLSKPANMYPGRSAVDYADKGLVALRISSFPFVSTGGDPNKSDESVDPALYDKLRNVFCTLNYTHVPFFFETPFAPSVPGTFRASPLDTQVLIPSQISLAESGPGLIAFGQVSSLQASSGLDVPTGWPTGSVHPMTFADSIAVYNLNGFPCGATGGLLKGIISFNQTFEIPRLTNFMVVAQTGVTGANRTTLPYGGAYRAKVGLMHRFCLTIAATGDGLIPNRLGQYTSPLTVQAFCVPPTGPKFSFVMPTASKYPFDIENNSLWRSTPAVQLSASQTYPGKAYADSMFNYLDTRTNPSERTASMTALRSALEA